MANREALRELQSRLAVKLEASRSATGVVASWLAVEAAGQRYLIPLRQAGEIFPVPPLQAVAHTRPWFRGVANLRGGLYGVVDLGEFRSPAAPDAPHPSLGDARLVTFNGLLDFNGALRVDRLWGLRGPEAFSRQDPPAADAPAWFGQRYTDTGDLAWQEINLQTLCALDEFVRIAA